MPALLPFGWPPIILDDGRIILDDCWSSRGGIEVRLEGSRERSRLSAAASVAFTSTESEDLSEEDDEKSMEAV